MKSATNISRRLDGVNPSQRMAAGVCAFVVALTVILAVGAAPSSAYEGPFCYEELRVEGGQCYSRERQNIRRAIGHVSNAYVWIAIVTTKGSKTGKCFNYPGCQANTGYIEKDGAGRGYINNEGPHGAQYTYGYLYP